ncbi:MAG: hypothetical protein JSS85_01050 [Bacteroidetes bacterium]|nr:hypothetical protein [Bacteroidota bacterium]
MKKIYFVTALLIFGTTAFSQSLDDVNGMLGKQKYKEAKSAIDKLLTDPKNAEKPDAYYFKGRVYNAYSYDTSLSKQERSTLKLDAFEAFKKNQQLDAKEIRLKFENYGSFLDLYGGLYDLGAAFFNAKQFAEAATAFKNAHDVEEYILSKGYTYNQITLHPLDTALVLNIAIAYSQAKDDDAAVPFFRKLADANVTGPNNLEVYEFLVDYYSKKKDKANFDQLIQKGRSLYPTEGYWNDMELKEVSDAGDRDALYAKYEELIAKKPSDFNLTYNYAIELYNSIYSQDGVRPKDMAAAKDKLTSALKAAIANDKGIEANNLMVNHLYNCAADFSTNASTIKGNKPEDIKKKAELKASANKKMDECIPYAEASVKYYEGQASLKTSQKASFQNILQYLSDMYKTKGDAKKAAEYDKKKSDIKF